MQIPTLKPQAFIFDMDGVLVSSEKVHWKAYRDTFASEGIEYPWEAYRETGLGISRENVIGKVLGELEEEKLLQLMKLKEDHVRTILAQERVERIPGALEFIGGIHRRGLKTAVATSSRNPHLFLEAGGYRDTFDLIVGRCDVQQPKPHPETYIETATKLGIAPADCLAFEDSPAGVEAALAAGMPVFALVTTHTKEEVSRATAVFEGFDQIELENLTP
ncbi:MAG: HAD family phosphatase [Planctomycetota bacterium]